MNTNLTQMKCVPCEGGTPPLASDKVRELRKQLNQDWRVVDNKKIKRDLKFIDFKKAMAFVNRVAGIAENEGHHPDIFVSYNKVGLELSTHAVDGLSENDFILAAKLDKLSRK